MFKKVLISFLVCLSISTAVISAEKPRWVAQPVTVFVPEYGKYTVLMKKAFMEWEQKSNRLIRFKFVNKPSNANITVNFVDHVDTCNSDLSVGCAKMQERAGVYFKSELDIAMKIRGNDNVYRPIGNIYGVMLHESGHAIGLDHSSNPNSIMYPYDLTTLQYLTNDDLELIYKKYH